MTVTAEIERDFEDQSFALNAEAGNWLLTTLYVNGYAMHLQAIRVTDGETIDGEPIVEDTSLQQAYDANCQEELERVFALYDSAFATTTIPGYEGDFILYAHPHGD